MEQNKLSVRQRETLPILWENDEEGAETATMTITNKITGSSVLSKTVPFVALIADLTLSSTETDIAVGEYDYMVTISYDDGTIEKYPDVAACSDCTLPTFEVCTANDETS